MTRVWNNLHHIRY